ncbi:hypothetical protein Drorol1_Dr00026282 [Drosera rotundifolia]
MEADGERPVPVLKDFTIQSSSVPLSPIKPNMAHSEELEDYLARLRDDNVPQRPVQSPTSNVETSSLISLVASQGLDLNEDLPRWSDVIQAKMSAMAQDATTFRQVDGKGINLSEQSVDDPLSHLGHVGFGEPLGMTQLGWTPSGSGTTLGDADLTGGCLVVDLNSPWKESFSLSPTASMTGDRAILGGLTQQINNYNMDMRQCDMPDLYADPNSPQSTQNSLSKGTRSVFAPATPDKSKFIWETISLSTDQAANEQNKDQESEVAATRVGPHEIQNEGENAAAGKVPTLLENHDPDKGSTDGIDLNKTPQQKPRKKKHRPKVVNEKKPKQAPNPVETPKTKRKYVRKNKSIPPSTMPLEPSKVPDQNVEDRAVRSCRRSLNFDLDGQPGQDSSLQKSSHDSYSATQGNAAYDLSFSVNLLLKGYIQLPQEEAPNTPCSTDTIPSQANESTFDKFRNVKTGSNRPIANPGEGYRRDGTKTDSLGAVTQNFGNNASSVDREHRPKRSCTYAVERLDADSRNLAATHGAFCSPSNRFFGDGKINSMASMFFPEICKKKRTEKVQRPNTTNASFFAAASPDVTQAVDGPGGNASASKYHFCPTSPNFTATLNSMPEAAGERSGCRFPIIHTWADIDKLKKKRTKALTRARDLASLSGFADGIDVGNRPSNLAQKQSQKEHVIVTSSADTCLKALTAADSDQARTTKKRTRTRCVSVYQSSNKAVKQQESFLALPWRDMSVDDDTVDSITHRLDGLDLNRESSNISWAEENALVPYHADGRIQASFGQRQNSLVPYRKDGTMVPFEGTFNPMKKRRERAKVDLDDETTKVWKLLLENIDNEGIDGTDEDKAKWWEEERRVFHGRVDSFIARMRLVQGDRRFSPWKGSVVDSCIGVFLTQNVSDHLSSSAFMSLAARFPLKPRSELNPLYKEAPNHSSEDSVLEVELESFKRWMAKSSEEPYCDRSSRTLHDADHCSEKEVVNSEELYEGNLCLNPQDNTRGIMHPNSCESSQTLSQESAQRGSNCTIEMETPSIPDNARVMDDISMSQNYVLSSQTSSNSPSGLTAGRTGSSSESNSEVEDLITSPNNRWLSHSCMELLKMAEIPVLHENCENEGSQEWFYQERADNDPDRKGHENQQIRALQNEIHAINCILVTDVDNRSDNSATKDDNCTTEESNLTTESTIQSPVQLKKVAMETLRPVSAEKLCSSYVLEGERMVMHSQRQVRDPQELTKSPAQESESFVSETVNFSPGKSPGEFATSQALDERKINGGNNLPGPVQHATGSATTLANSGDTKQTKGKAIKEKKPAFDWDSLRKQVEADGKKGRPPHHMDSLDYEAVRLADLSEIADTIKERGMNNMLAERMKDFLNRLVNDHGSMDLEWLRDVPPDKAKEYLLSVRGLGLKSVECVRLLTLHHLAFPVDTNVGRIAVRLGWVPLQPLPESLQLHLLELYPVLESIQKYLWPRLCRLDQRTLYELHYHMITFGKVFCTKRTPNCNACPLRGECRHFASAFASARLALPGPEEKSIVASTHSGATHLDPRAVINQFALPSTQANQHTAHCGTSCDDPQVIIDPLPEANQLASTHPCLTYQVPQVNISPVPSSLPLETQNSEEIITNCEPIVEVPASPEPEQTESTLSDIEDMFSEDPNEIPIIKLNMREFTQTLESYLQSKMELQQSEMSKALVTLTADTASIPMPRLKNVSRLRTEHHVYELPDDHPLLDGLDKREPDDPGSYLLAIWTPGETADSIQPPQQRCGSQEPGRLCNDESCSNCNSQREANCQIVRGTLLIPCRTAMRGSFPLNGTYFQVNEVFADHDSSLNPIAVPRHWLWNLPRRTVYFGTSVPTIFKGLTTEGIQHCFWRGYVCVRGFDQKTRAPRPLMARLHFPASKMTKAKGKPTDPTKTT